MEHGVKYRFFMSQLTVIKDLKETEKTKISIVCREGFDAPCILRVCKNKDLSGVYEVLRKHPNPSTAVVYDFVYENGDTYILEELVDGSTVSELLENEGTFTEQRTAKIIIEICNALDVLHNEKPPVVHNDINPSNIKIREDGSVKLFDFDISRTYKKGQSQNTVLFGTEEFAAPEHYGYGQSEPRTDIYCLGVTMHKMLTGRGLSSEHRITYNGLLKSIIRKCLEFDPKNRYATVLDLKKDLEKFLNKKKRALSILLVILLAGAVIGGLALAWESVKSSVQEESTETIATAPTGVTEDVQNTTEGTLVPDETKTPTVEPTKAPNESATTEPTIPAINNSRETAWSIPFDEMQSGSFYEGQAKWYKFNTDADAAVYRLEAFPQRESYAYVYLRVALFDQYGIKRDDFLVHCMDEYGFLDLYLEPGTEYFLKVWGTDLGDTSKCGSYEVCVSKRLRDAGIDKDTATPLVLGQRHSATIDSTLSDWFVFQVPETGEYTYTIHNIDVGCDIYFSKQQPRSAGEGNYIKNEDNYSGKIPNMQEGEQVYFEIYAYNKNPKANGKYIIVIEKSTT